VSADTLTASEVVVIRGGRAIVSEVSLSITPGEVVVILGPNGAGKSTLLSALAGDLLPDSGSVTLRHKTIASWSSRELSRQRAFLPQRSSLDFPLNVLDVALLGRAPYHAGVERRDDLSIAWRALCATGMEGYAERRYTTLSGGEQQRVQIARVLAQLWGDRHATPGPPPFLLVDEPTASLDLRHVHELLRLMREQADGALQCGVVAVLHDVHLASLYADRIALLSHGRLQALGTPGDVLTCERLEHVYGLPVRVVQDQAGGPPLFVPRVESRS